MNDSQLKNYAILVSETYDRWATVAFDLPSIAEECRKHGQDVDDVWIEVYYQSGGVVVLDSGKLSSPTSPVDADAYERREWLPDSELIAIEEAGFVPAMYSGDEDDA